MWLFKIAVGLAVLYGLVLAALYFAQTWMIFPAGLAARSAPPLPATAERIETTNAEGNRLVGVRIGAEGGTGNPVILGFGGNAWNADAAALYLHRLFPDHPVVAFHYRGYAPSEGSPSARGIMDDALVIHDFVAGDVSDARIVAVGLSIGAGPAANLAANRPIAGLILVTPFDSLAALASQHYPWVPVRPFLRHRMPVADLVATTEAAVAVIAAGRDTIVPAARSAPVAEVAPRLAFSLVIDDAGHNDIYDRQDFAAAMREALDAVLSP